MGPRDLSRTASTLTRHFHSSLITHHPLTATTHNGLCKTRRDLIESCGRLCQILGLPKTTGQIYGLLYLSLEPLSLDQMVELLGISKASASMGTRHLEIWGAVRHVWVPGNRRDYYEAIVDLTDLARGSYRNIVKPRMHSTRKRLDGMLSNLDQELASGQINHEEHRLCIERLKNLSKLQRKVATLLPMAERLFCSHSLTH